MLYTLNTVSGAKTYLRLILVQNPESAPLPQACLTLKTDTETLHLTPDTIATNEFIIPPLVSGRYSYELLIAEHPTLHGVLVVRPSALSGHPAECTADIRIDLPCILVSLTQGPRGLKGERGFSAYEVASQNGYQKSESEWVAELEGSQAAATEAKTQASEAGKQATAAADSAKTAASSATTADSRADAADKSATAAAKSADSAKQDADRAKDEADRANNAMTEIENNLLPAAQTAKNDADAAKKDAQTYAENAASSATTAGSHAGAADKSAEAALISATAAASSATAAAQSAADAAFSLADAAQVGANNTFTESNTFNGALVANGPTTLTAQTTVDGTSVPDLQEMQAALTVFLEGIGELSLETQLQPMRGCHAKTWNDWAALNPTWPQQDTLIFYAPFAPEANRANMASNAAVTNPSVLRSIWISPMLPDWDNSSGERISKALGKNICLYCTKSGDIDRSLANCYYVKKATIITPNATIYSRFLSNLGFLTSKNDNEIHIYAPNLDTITDVGGHNSTFDYMPILSAFSIYAPNLASSFYFSRGTYHADTEGYMLGQTCEVLQALIAGIGTAPVPDPNAEPPIEQQTITTLYPQGTEEEITELEAVAAAKNWKFIFNKTKK